MDRKKITIVEDDAFLRQQIALSLGKDYVVLQASDRMEAEKILAQEKPEVCLLDLNLPPSGKSQEGIRILESIKKENPDTVVIVMSGNQDKRVILKAVEAGASDFFTKPFDLTELKLILQRALEMQRMKSENERLRAELRTKYSFQNIIGQSSSMLRVFESVKRVAETNATVIIRGESGTGKELIAKAIHYNSGRSEFPFISVNCAALPETLVESELFGHERGAFTGAVASHTGRFELAHHGTLFLDEIGSITPLVQSKLLRVLQDRCFERVGGTRKITVDVRLITATNEDLEQKVNQGTFREDLYYRIHVFPIHLPPLRERTEDIPLLLDHFVRFFCIEQRLPVKRFDSSSLEALVAYPWRGNVRELENLVQTLVLMADGAVISLDHLPSHIVGDRPTGAPTSETFTDKGIKLDSAVDQFERSLILSALQRANGKKVKAAELLGVDKNRIKYLCRKHKI